jgi:AP2 domain
MKMIPLTQGQVALVDDADFEWLSAFKWHAHKRPGGTFYALRNVPSLRGGRTTLRMHRAILSGIPEVDHVNRNSLDNQRYNLRPATHSQNLANRGCQIDNTSGFKGVSWHKGSSKWHARIIVNQLCQYLGTFSEIEAAARAYDAAARENFGEFACLNFPEAASYECHQSTQAAPNQTL